MKLAVIGTIIIALLILAGFVGYVAISESSDPIPPYDGDEQGDPDSGDGQQPDDILIAVKFVEPNSNPYNVPSTGCELGKYFSMFTGVYVYGTSISDVNSLLFQWVGTDYSKFTLSKNAKNSPSDIWDKIDEYNIYITHRMDIYRLSSGKHLLKVQAFDTANKVLAEATLEVVIPQYWVYHHDYRSPPNVEGTVWRGVGGTHLGDEWFYGFTFPYQPYVNDPVPAKKCDDWYWLEGKIVKAKGQLDVTMDCAAHQQIGLEVCVHPNLWDGVAGKWYQYSDFTKVPVPCSGWSSNFETNFRSYWGNEIGWCAAYGQAGGRYWIDKIHGFVGDVYIVPGTLTKGESPLEIVMNFFSIKESQYGKPIDL